MVGNDTDRYVFEGQRAIQNARTLLDGIDLDDAVQLEIAVTYPSRPGRRPTGDDGGDEEQPELFPDEFESFDEFLDEGVSDPSETDETDADGEYDCPECGRAFDTSQGLSGHMSEHTDPSGYEIAGSVAGSGRLVNNPEQARDVLGAIETMDDPTSGEIADALGAERGRITNVLTPLYRLRYVDRDSYAVDDDITGGWEYRYELTGRGGQVLRWLESDADPSVFSLPPDGVRD